MDDDVNMLSVWFLEKNDARGFEIEMGEADSVVGHFPEHADFVLEDIEGEIVVAVEKCGGLWVQFQVFSVVSSELF